MRPIEVRDLRKAYGEVQAVDGVSFEIERGEVFALLGPNGAGKTTVVEIIATAPPMASADTRSAPPMSTSMRCAEIHGSTGPARNAASASPARARAVTRPVRPAVSPAATTAVAVSSGPTGPVGGAARRPRRLPTSPGRGSTMPFTVSSLVRSPE